MLLTTEREASKLMYGIRLSNMRERPPAGVAFSLHLEGDEWMVQEKRGRWLALLRKEPVLCIAAVCAAVSTLLNPPSPAYLNYIDWRVLTLLFCLMAVVAGLQECGVFAVLAQRLLAGERRMRLVSLALVLLPFFVSMVVTNDVALITFVPFAVLVLGLIGRTEYLAPLVVLQTMAANLGSMATPVGNPQNLYLYADYELTAEQFFGTMLPLTLVSLAVLTAASLLCVRDEGIQVRFQEQAELRRPGRLGLMAGLFVLCLLSVFRVLPYPALLAVVAGGRCSLTGVVSQGGLWPACYLFLLLPVCRKHRGLRPGTCRPGLLDGRPHGADHRPDQPDHQQRSGSSAPVIYSGLARPSGGLQPGRVGDPHCLAGQPHLD